MNSNNFKQNPDLEKPSNKPETESSAEILEQYSVRFELNGEFYMLLVQGFKDSYGNVRFKFIHNEDHPYSTFVKFVDKINKLGRRVVTLVIKEQKLTKLNITFKVVDGKLVFHKAEEPSINTLVSYYKASRFRSKDDSNEES